MTTQEIITSIAKLSPTEQEVLLNRLKKKYAGTKRSNIQKGNYTAKDKPSQFGGIWKGREVNLNKLRAKAWERKI